MMTTSETLRNNIIGRLMTISDEHYLQTLDRLLTESKVSDGRVTLNDAQVKMLELSMADLKAGRTVSQEELDAEDMKWLGEQ
jgi:predicted transcriptional regulator